MSYTIFLLATLGWIWTALFFGWIGLSHLQRRRRSSSTPSTAVSDA